MSSDHLNIVTLTFDMLHECLSNYEKANSEQISMRQATATHRQDAAS